MFVIASDVPAEIQILYSTRYGELQLEVDLGPLSDVEHPRRRNGAPAVARRVASDALHADQHALQPLHHHHSLYLPAVTAT